MKDQERALMGVKGEKAKVHGAGNRHLQSFRLSVVNISLNFETLAYVDSLLKIYLQCEWESELKAGAVCGVSNEELVVIQVLRNDINALFYPF